MLKSFGMGDDAQLAFFSSQNIDKNELTGFREHKNALISLTEAILQDSLASHSKEASILNDLFQLRATAVKAFSDKMHAIQTEQGLLTSPSMILNSILHMNCNRLLGRDRKKENRARLFAHHTLTVLDSKAKAKAKT